MATPKVRRLWEVEPSVSKPPRAKSEDKLLLDEPEPNIPAPAAQSPSVLTPQDIAVQELARSCSPRRAAAKAGVSLEQVQQWMSTPGVMEHIQEERMAGVVETAFIISRLGPKAARVLESEMTRTKRNQTSSGRRTRAAKAVLEFFNKSVELLQLVPQLRALEQALADRGIALPPAPTHIPDANVIDVDVISADVSQ